MVVLKILIFFLLYFFLWCFSLENRINIFDIIGNILFEKYIVFVKFCVFGNDKISVFLLCVIDECF